MIIRSLLLLLSLLFPSFIYAAVPPYIEKDTLEDICKKVTCHPDLNKAYLGYYTKQFHKAFAVYTYKSGGKNYLSYAAWTYQYPNSYEAEKNAIKNCNKSGIDCEILFRNNSIPNEDLYNRLTQPSNTEISSTKTIIPKNAHKAGNTWSCDFGFYKENLGCKKLPVNASASVNGVGWSCNFNYVKRGNSCIKKETTINSSFASKKIIVPANAYATGFGNQGWKCNSGFTQNGNNCISKNNTNKIPENAYKLSSGWKCNKGFFRLDTSDYCYKLPDNSYALSPTGFNCEPGYKKSDGDYYCIKSKSNIAVTSDKNSSSSTSSTNYNSDEANDKYVADTMEGKTGLGKILKWAGLLKDNKPKSASSTHKQVNIPNNAYKSGNSWKCKSGYYRHQTIDYCYRLPANSYALSTRGWACNSGYTKSESICIRYIAKTNNSSSNYKSNSSSFTFKGLIEDVLDYTGLSDTNEFNAKLYNPPSLYQANGGYLYGDQLFAGSGGGMIGYVKGGYVYDTSMRRIGFVSNNTIYDTEGQYISPLGPDIMPGKIDMFDTSNSIFNSNNHTFDMTPFNGTNQRKYNTPGLNYNSGSVDMFDTSTGIFDTSNSIFNSNNHTFDMTPGF